MQMVCCTFMLAAIWSMGTWPGPSTITCTSLSQARLGQLAQPDQLLDLAHVGGVGQTAGAAGVPREMVTSYSRQMSRISS